MSRADRVAANGGGEAVVVVVFTFIRNHIPSCKGVRLNEAIFFIVLALEGIFQSLASFVVLFLCCCSHCSKEE